MTSYLVPFRSYCRLLFTCWTKNGHFAFLSPYTVHFRLIGKLAVDLLLMNSFRYVIPLMRDKRISIKKIGVFAPTGSVWPKILGRMGRPTNQSCQKTRMKDLSCGIKMWAQVSFLLSQSTTDGRTDISLMAIYSASHCMQSHGKVNQF